MMMTEKKRHPIYQEAVDADKCYDEAIKKQFGPNTHRSNVFLEDYNFETEEAYKRKLIADLALICFMQQQRRENKGLPMYPR